MTGRGIKAKVPLISAGPIEKQRARKMSPVSMLILQRLTDRGELL